MQHPRQAGSNFEGAEISGRRFELSKAPRTANKAGISTAATDSMRKMPGGYDDSVVGLDSAAPTLREAQPTKRPYAAPVMPHTMLVHPRQKGNPVLNHVKNVKWEFNGEILPDFQMGQYTAGLYLSLRYHLLHPDYLDLRIRELQREFRLQVLLVMVDVDDADEMIVKLTRLANLNKVTMILTWSNEELARYIETYKAYEKKPADIIQGSLGGDYYTQLQDVLTSIRSINKSDVYTLASTFGSLQAIMNASVEQLQLCPGLGEKKVNRIYEAFHEPIGLGGGVRVAGVTG